MIPHIALDVGVVELQQELDHLAGCVDEAMQGGIKALAGFDAVLARQVSAADDSVNRERFELEEHCYSLLKISGLSESDVRVIVGTVNVATNLERTADHIAGIAHLIVRMSVEKPTPIPAEVLEIAGIARELVNAAVAAFLTRNDELAENVVRRGREIDDLQAQLYLHMYTERRLDDPTSLLLLWIVRNLERIGDRAVNICERAIFVTTGEMKEFR